MKKTLILTLAAVAALLAASCQKEEGRVLTATIEQYEHNSKAYIDDDHYACWENSDAVNINGTPHSISLSTGGQANTATILGTENLSGNLMAYYPADGVTDLTSTGGTVKLPHIQTYAENTDGKQIINNPMAAYCPDSGTKLRFRNLCALLKVTIVGSTSIKGIQVKGIDNQMLWGEAQLMLNNQNQPMLTSFTKGSNSVTLQIPQGVTPSSNTFYIVVPAASNFENLTIAVLTFDGNNYANNSKTSLIGQSLSRNQIGAISYTPNGEEDATFTPDWMIRYTATEAINTTNITAIEFGSTFQDSDFDNDNGYLLFDGPVTTIPAGISSGSNSGSKYFKSCSSITLPASLTSIGNYAFYKCSNLTSISLPQGVTSIGTNAFQSCSSLTSISLPANLTSIGNRAFSGCSSLTSISLPANLTSMGTYVFYGCSSLTSINLPANLTSIGNYVFQNCSSLTSISLPANLTSIGNYVFQNCSSLTSISLPQGVTSIGTNAFQSCSNLTSITLPASLTSIGTNAFLSCSSLTSISLPQGVTSIANFTFQDCSSLTSITLPESLTSIGLNAFQSCSSLTSISLPQGVTWIGNYAFLKCSSLTSISLPQGVTSIGIGTFQDCSSLTSINLPASLTSIGSNAFYNCTSLTSISLPQGVTQIGSSAFRDCSSLERVDCHPTTPPALGTNTFSTISTASAVLHVPSGHGSDYSDWSSYFQGGIVEGF